jgi:predicted regulator of Ras-like GTPase activity (Roadblock/LC7/MglB family)
VETSWDTPTMAELFLKQGQAGRALAIYRKLASERPDDPEVRRRLDEILAERGGAMSFHEQLQNIIDSTPGAIAGMIMGFDGIPVDTYEKNPGEFDVATFLTEYASAVHLIRNAADNLEPQQPGAITEIGLSSENLIALMRLLTPDVFLGVVLKQGGLSGKARFLMRIAAPVISKELF